LSTASTAAKSKRARKERLYSLFAQPALALANPHRLELIDLLAQAPRTVEELAGEARMSIANTSQHLQRLKQARLVEAQREGVRVRYRLADPAIARLWLDLRRVGQARLPEVERALDDYRDSRRRLSSIAPEELQRLRARGEAVLIDARPAVEYAAGHLPGAVSLPPDAAGEASRLLPRGKTVVAYCRGPFCVYADDVLARLAERGWKVARLEEGVLEWQERGLPLAK
jgi:rhodanese-related sulfurtransferase